MTLVIRSLAVGEEDVFASMPDPFPDVRQISYADGLTFGGYRPETTWVAVQDGRVVARAAWLDPPGAVGGPWLERFDLGTSAEVGAALLGAAQEAMGVTTYFATLPPDWRSRPDLSPVRQAALLAGLVEHEERVRFSRPGPAAPVAHSGRPGPAAPKAPPVKRAPVVSEASAVPEARFGRPGLAVPEASAVREARFGRPGPVVPEAPAVPQADVGRSGTVTPGSDPDRPGPAAVKGSSGPVGRQAPLDRLGEEAGGPADVEPAGRRDLFGPDLGADIAGFRESDDDGSVTGSRLGVRPAAGVEEIERLVGLIDEPSLLTGVETAMQMRGVDLARQPLRWLGETPETWRVVLEGGEPVGLAAAAGDACLPMIAYLGTRTADALPALLAGTIGALTEAEAIVADVDADNHAVVAELRRAGFVPIRSRVRFSAARPVRPDYAWARRETRRRTSQ